MLEVVYVLYGGGLIALMSSVQDGSLQNSCNMRISLWSFTHGKDPPRSLFDMDEGWSLETLLFFGHKAPALSAIRSLILFFLDCLLGRIHFRWNTVKSAAGLLSLSGSQISSYLLIHPLQLSWLVLGLGWHHLEASCRFVLPRNPAEFCICNSCWHYQV